MILTNELGLPGPIVEAIAADDYDPGDSDITVTKLIAPPRVVALTRQHGGQLVEDASDRIWALMGQAIHTILERAAPAEGRIVERRFGATVDGYRLSGQVDLIEGRTLSDYKMMSVWEIIHGIKSEKVQQLNVLAWLARQNGIEIDKLQIVGILRDWSKSKAATVSDFPKRQIAVVSVPMWPLAQAAAFISERLAAHAAAAVKLPECSAEERWAKPESWAVMKAGRKSAVRVLFDEAFVIQWCKLNGAVDAEGNLKPGYSVVHRPGESVRCQHYCAVSEYCDQWKALRATD